MGKPKELIHHLIQEGCPAKYVRMVCGMPAKGAAKHHMIAFHRAHVTCVDCLRELENVPLPQFGAPASMKPYVDWVNGGDSGISSKTLLSAITGVNFMDRFGPGVPRDPADFGRCYRLLERFPELRPQLSKVAEKHPVWTRLVERWSDLEVMYRAAIDSGAETAPELYRAIQDAIS